MHCWVEGLWKCDSINVYAVPPIIPTPFFSLLLNETWYKIPWLSKVIKHAIDFMLSGTAH